MSFVLFYVSGSVVSSVVSVVGGLIAIPVRDELFDRVGFLLAFLRCEVEEGGKSCSIR